jgi:ethanolamine utilization protein EutN
MIICKVVGEIVSTVKNPEFEGHKLLVVQPLNLKNEYEGASFIAIDKVDAGMDDLVLINKEGGSARIALENEKIPVQAVVVAVIDGVEVFGNDEC